MLQSAHFVLAAAALLTTVSAQCTNPWLSEAALGGTDGVVFDAKVWDPDGSGPQAPVVAFVGSFEVVGATPVQLAATYDPMSGAIAPVATGGLSAPLFSARTHALAVMPNGDLIVGGGFASIGGVAAPNIARYDGTAWTPLGTWTNGAVWSLTVLPNGDVVAGDNTALYLWNGSTWATIATLGPGPGFFNTVGIDGSGQLIAAGSFSSISGVAANSVARWDGVVWSPLGAGIDVANGTVLAVEPLPNGNLIASGSFATAGGSPAANIARWDGAAWSPLGSGLDAMVRNLTVAANGDLIAVGEFTSAGGVPASGVARWNGSSWWSTGIPQLGRNRAVAELPNGDLLVFADRLLAGTSGPSVLMRSNGSSWTSAVDGLDGPISSATVLGDGDVLVAGRFTRVGSVDARGVARKTGIGWTALGNGIEGFARATAELANGDLVVAGNLGPAFQQGVLAWDGQSWSPLGGGVALSSATASVSALAPTPAGGLIVAGEFASAGSSGIANLALWNGATWNTLGASPDGHVTAVDVLPNGNVIIVGTFQTIGGVAARGIARWNGTSWSGVGSGLVGTPHSLAATPSGEIYVGGFLATGAGSILLGLGYWNGTSWSSLGQGVNDRVFALQILPNGDLLAGGRFFVAGGLSAPALARWNGSTWSSVTADVRARISVPVVAAFAARTNGDVVVVGDFESVDGVVSPFITTLSTDCAATSVPLGSGCVGTGGVNALAAVSLPWIGSTYRATATGMPQQSVAFSVMGFGTQSVPLGSLLSIGGVGCDLLTTPDYVEVLPPANAQVEVALALPNAPGLVGIAFSHQVVPLGIDAGGNLTEFTSTNALQLTVGSF